MQESEREGERERERGRERGLSVCEHLSMYLPMYLCICIYICIDLCIFLSIIYVNREREKKREIQGKEWNGSLKRSLCMRQRGPISMRGAMCVDASKSSYL